MAECLRRSCPCLDTLWQRILGEKKSADGNLGIGDGSAGARDGETEASPPRAPQSGSIYTALWSFTARTPEELSFQEGDLFNVTSRNGDWWAARKIEKNGCVLGTGLVPRNYLARESVEVQPWYFGQMNRFEAQSHLLGPGNEEGSFLVRRSERDDVGFVLSVRTSTLRVKHYKVIQTDDQQFHVEQNQQFPTLVDLVDHYCVNSLINSSRLKSTCKRKDPKETDLPQWELPKEDFELKEQLGSGYFADVHRGVWKNRINVAVKIIKSDTELNHCDFQREVQILKSLRHHHLISLFAVCTASAPFYIITELMEKGSLLTFLRGTEGQQLDVESLIEMGAQVADGMAYLEENNSIHRDLAARNVLVGVDNICKVADFGLARVIKEPFYITADKKIPYKWSAPEAISHGKFSNKSDVWSFGILLFEIITYGGIPYPAFSNQEVYQQVMNGYRMSIPPKCPDYLYDIMLACWSAKPEDRPDFKTLKFQLEGRSYEFEETDTPSSTLSSAPQGDGRDTDSTSGLSPSTEMIDHNQNN